MTSCVLKHLHHSSLPGCPIAMPRIRSVGLVFAPRMCTAAMRSRDLLPQSCIFRQRSHDLLSYTIICQTAQGDLLLAATLRVGSGRWTVTEEPSSAAAWHGDKERSVAAYLPELMPGTPSAQPARGHAVPAPSSSAAPPLSAREYQPAPASAARIDGNIAHRGEQMACSGRDEGAIVPQRPCVRSSSRAGWPAGLPFHRGHH